MTLRELELFLTVADEKSFAKAAQKLFISQPAVTQQIKKTEKELGFSLFRRDKHSVELTVQGEIMLDAARNILYTYNQAIADSLRSTSSEETLNIGYVGQMNIYLLPKIMKSFQTSYPKHRILASMVQPNQVTAYLERGMLRLIITPYDLVENSPRLHFYPLCYDRHYCVMNTGSVLASRESLSYQDLSGFTILTPSEELCPGHMRRAIAELKRINKNCMFELGHDTNNVTLQLMSSDRKLAMMPGYTRPTHQNLVSVPLENGIAIRVGVAYLETLSTLEKAFLSTSYQVLKINGIKGA